MNMFRNSSRNIFKYVVNIQFSTILLTEQHKMSQQCEIIFTSNFIHILPSACIFPHNIRLHLPIPFCSILQSLLLTSYKMCRHSQDTIGHVHLKSKV